MDRDPYRDFASRYDAFSEGTAEAAALRQRFFKGLFERHGVRRLLDCACGNGTDLLLFRSLCLDVVGSDLSDAMLALAKERLEAAGVDAPLVRADFRELSGHVDGPFDAVVCLSTSLPHLPEDAEILKALSSMRNVLRDGGPLVLDQGMTDRQWAEKPRFIPAINTPELCRLMAIDYAKDRFTVHVVDFADVGAERAFYHDTFVYRRLLRDDYDRLLRAAGFRDVSFYGRFDEEPYDEQQSPRLICVAVK